MHTRSTRVAEVARISGPLAPYLTGFKATLAGDGHESLA
jgi:hypothetical protein